MAALSGQYALVLSGKQTLSERLLPAPRARQRHIDPSQGVLITGGTKGLGLEYARSAVRKGAKIALLLSRNALMGQEDLESLSETDTAVFTISCDASDCKGLGNITGWARSCLPPIQVNVQALKDLKTYHHMTCP